VNILRPTKKVIKTLSILSLLLLFVTGGLAYADYKEYRYTSASRVENKFPQNTSITFNQYGTYKSVLDTEKNKWTIGLWEDTLILPGSKNISDIQRDGGVITFEMPWDGEIYNNAGEIYINDKLWSNGNPVLNSKIQSEIKKGSKVEIRYGKENQSAGFQIWFE